jgi:hypothetical protein
MDFEFGTKFVHFLEDHSRKIPPNFLLNGSVVSEE